MRAFAAAMLMIGGALSAYASPSDGQGVFADSVEPRAVEAGLDTSARCNPEDIAVYGPQLPPTNDRQCPAHTGEADETARARAYLIATATPGYTMTRQGPERAIERLHPEFVNRLAAAITEARAAGLSLAGIFSAYRLRRRRFRRQISLAPHLRAGGRRHWDWRTRQSKFTALARDRGAPRRDLPLWTAQPTGMCRPSALVGQNELIA